MANVTPQEQAAAPPTLDDIVGQDCALDVLRRAAGSGRVHHAWVFQGPPGVGKRMAAMAFGAMLLEPPDAADSPHGQGDAPTTLGVVGVPPASPEASRLLRANTHPDLHLVTKELARLSDDAAIRARKLLNIPLDVLRTRVLEPATLAPSIGGGIGAQKVFVVDEAELIDARGQNALLKTLEEPPDGTVLMLITSRPERLLATIRSRCQRVAFDRLDKASMQTWLSRQVDMANVDTPMLLAMADGSPGAAQIALTTGLLEWPALIEPKLCEIDAGRASPDCGRTMGDCVSTWASAWVDAHDGASKEAANKAGAAHMFTMLAARYARRLAGDDPEHAADAIDAVAQSEATMNAGVQAGFVFENLAARLMELRHS